MTQSALADFSGLSESFLSMVERGQRSLNRYSDIVALAAALRVPPAELAPGMPGIAAPDSATEVHSPASGQSAKDRSSPGWAQRLTALRRARAWSPADLACELKKLRADLPPAKSLKHMIQADWESGKHRPGPRYRLLLAAIYDADEQDIFGDGFHDMPSANGELATCVPEREPGMRTTTEDEEDVIDVLSRIRALNRAVDPETIRHLQGSLRHTLAEYEKLDHSNLVPALLKQRSWMDSLLDECNHPRQRQQLFEIAGATSGLLGYVAVGRGDFPLARAYCTEAFQLGDFAQDSNLQAWARGLQSFCEYYARQYDEAVRLATDGLNYAQSGPQSVRLAINGVARAKGKLGDAEGVRRAVDEAYELMSRNDVPGGLPSSVALECYSAAQTASNAATAYVSLGIPEKVQHYVDLALPEISKSESPWSRSLVMIDLAFSLTRRKEADVDRASGLVLGALGISEGRPIISVQQRASEFVRDASDRWGEIRQVSEVRAAVSTLEVR